MTPEEFSEFIEESGLKDHSFILVVFDELGQVKKNTAMNLVMPEQILALSSELEVMGKNMIMQRETMRAMEQQQQRPNIQVPNPKIQVP